MASWLYVPDRAVRVRGLAGDNSVIFLGNDTCPTLFIQVYESVPANLMLGVALYDRLESHPGREVNIPRLDFPFLAF